MVYYELIVKQRGSYEINFRDGYRRGAADVILKKTSLGQRSWHNITTLENTRAYWGQIRSNY